MNCKKAETFLLRAFDGLLKSDEKKDLTTHLEECSHCRKRKEDYAFILESLKTKDYPEPQAYFWERLKPKLNEQKKYEPWYVWKRWSLRAVPFAIVAVTALALVFAFLLPQPPEELSESEVLLLRNQDPFQETRSLFEEEGIENKNMMLIFASLDESNGSRRYFP